MATIDEHRATSHISIDRYERARIVQLGRSLDNRTPIYLDTKFWILLRDAALSGGGQAAPEYELLDLLSNLVARDRIFCPISESIFLELMKQSDRDSRVRTAKLIDDLSLGVALIPYDRRIATEIAHFLHSFHAKGDTLHRLNHLMFSKLSYVLGVMHPVPEQLDKATVLAIQKAFMDRMWLLPLTEMIEVIGAYPAEDLDNTRWANVINKGNARHADEIRSFEQTWDAEIRGVVEFCGDLIMDVVGSMAESQNVSPPTKGTPEYLSARSKFQNVVYHGLKKRPEVRKQWRSLYIEACLHAAFRWDKKRRFEPNDMYDFHHACAALGYCSAFFTEHGLKTVLSSPRLDLNKLFECRVISDVDEALAYVKGLNSLDKS